MSRHLRIGEKQRVAGLAINDLLEPNREHEYRPNPARPYDGHVWGDVTAVGFARRLRQSAVDVKQRKAREILAV